MSRKLSTLALAAGLSLQVSIVAASACPPVKMYQETSGGRYEYTLAVLRGDEWQRLGLRDRLPHDPPPFQSNALYFVVYGGSPRDGPNIYEAHELSEFLKWPDFVGGSERQFRWNAPSTQHNASLANEFKNCWKNSSLASSSGRVEPDLDLVTPQVSGCPKYLRKTMVSWTRKTGSNPQLNVWEVQNVSKRMLKVTYRADGANSDTGTLNPGNSEEVWGLSDVPPYVVRDFKELMDFNRTQPQRKSLQCELSIRPR